jgi:protease IV
MEEQDNKNWEKTILQELAQSGLVELRRTRRWKILFKIVYLLIFLLIAVVIFGLSGPSDPMRSVKASHTALIQLTGPIADNTPANADLINEELEEAFQNTHVKGIILQLNSPGGSPVQSDYIYTFIKKMRQRHPKVKLYAVCSDACASGAYYIASAADQIYANPASLVGSIGVVMSNFGFVDLIKKMGVERRLFTAGENKGSLDPFLPLDANQVEHVQAMLTSIHHLFIARVKAGRGNRLKPSKDLFSGRVWTGEEALQLGLIDGYGSVDDVAQHVIQEKRIIDYTREPSPFSRIARRIGVEWGESFASGFASVLQHIAWNA